MKKFLLFSFLIIASFSWAQDKDKKPKRNEGIDPKYMYCYKDATIENDDYKIYIIDPRNEDVYAKLKIRIFNKTNDYLIFKPSEFSFVINEQDLNSRDKQIVVPPNDEVTHVIDVKGHVLQANKYTFEIKTYYKVVASGSVVKAEDFQLPTKEKEMTVGAFKCKVMEVKLRGDKSIVKYGCTYEGDGVGILDPIKAVGVMPKGQEAANIRKYEASRLDKGKFEDFFVEVKSVKDGGNMEKEPWKIKWNETFRDAKLTSLKGDKLEIEIDPARTADANK